MDSNKEKEQEMPLHIKRKKANEGNIEPNSKGTNTMPKHGFDDQDNL